MDLSPVKSLIDLIGEDLAQGFAQWNPKQEDKVGDAGYTKIFEVLCGAENHPNKDEKSLPVGEETESTGDAFVTKIFEVPCEATGDKVGNDEKREDTSLDDSTKEEVADGIGTAKPNEYSTDDTDVPRQPKTSQAMAACEVVNPADGTVEIYVVVGTRTDIADHTEDGETYDDAQEEPADGTITVNDEDDTADGIIDEH